MKSVSVLMFNRRVGRSGTIRQIYFAKRLLYVRLAYISYVLHTARTAGPDGLLQLPSFRADLLRWVVPSVAGIENVCRPESL